VINVHKLTDNTYGFVMGFRIFGNYLIS
jgi:hypothetical protein